MDYRSSLRRMGVTARVFKCDPATWLEVALPDGFVNESTVSKSYVQSLIQSLSEKADPPMFDAQRGFHQFSQVFPMKDGEAPGDLYLQAINSTISSVIKAAEHLNLREYGYTASMSESSDVFQHLLFDQLSGLTDDGASVLTFSVEADADGIAKSKSLIITGANVIMSRNPCRRYIYGLSLHGCMATFWRFDRLSILVSETFNFQKTPHFFIHMILFLGLARKHQLGLDPTICRVENKRSEGSKQDRSPSFIYRLGGKRYRTMGPPIYDNPATILCSHGTRVWAVREVDEGGSWVPGTTQHVLKDFWADVDRPRDSECQAAIKERLRRLDNDGGHRAEEIDGYFLSIRHEEDILSDGQPDVTLAIPDSVIRDDCSWIGRRSHAYYSWADYDPSLVFYSDPGEFSSSHSPSVRVHRRLLYEQMCRRLTDYTELTVILDCFKQFSNGLNLFRQAAYVHRDISVGNCLVYEKNGTYHAKICDLEFCQDYTSLSPTDPIMGTREFMATETPRKCLAWCSLPTNDRPAYHYHFLHDLESLYWLLLWIILGREPTACTIEPADKTYTTWQEEFGLLFSRSSRPSTVTQIYLARRLFMLDDSDQGFINWSHVFREQGLPSKDLFRPLFDIRFAWVATYTEIEQTLQDAATGLWPTTCFTEDLYNMFCKMVDQVIASIPEGGIQIRSILQKLYKHYEIVDTVILS